MTRTAPFAASASVRTPSPNSDWDSNCFSISASLSNDAAVVAGSDVSNPLNSSFSFSSVELDALKLSPRASKISSVSVKSKTAVLSPPSTALLFVLTVSLRFEMIDFVVAACVATSPPFSLAPETIKLAT